MEPDMATSEEFMATSEEFMAPADQSQIARGKRTKRPRTTSHSPPSPAEITTSISISSGLESFADDDRSSYGSAATDEEQDMANCLILLAQGGGIKTTSSSNGEEKNDNIIIVENGNSSKVVVVVDPDHTSSFECKTCSKSFHSFQALGGHRASHKKPKTSSTSNNEIIDEAKLFNKTNKDNIFINNLNSSPTIHKSSLPPSSSTSKVHQCSICGSVFSSGQALGGHMRRHRTAPVISSLKPRSILSLDLNLPAPEDDDHFYGEPKFHHQFATNHKRPFAFSAPALVDCHY